MNMDGYRFAHWYDLLWDRSDSVQPELALLEPLAQDAHHVLEVGAGTGRLALALAEGGVKVTCIEPSDAMRTVFLAKLAQRPHLFPRITLMPGSTAPTDLIESVGLAYMAGVIHHLLTTEELDALLAEVQRVLLPDGRLVIDSVAARPATSPLPQTVAGTVRIGAFEYRTTMWQELLAPPIHRWTFCYEIVREKTVIERNEEVSIGREWLREELERALERRGFAVESVHGGYEGQPVVEETSSLVVVARPVGEHGAP